MTLPSINEDSAHSLLPGLGRMCPVIESAEPGGLRLCPLKLTDSSEFARLGYTDAVCRMTGTVVAPNAVLAADHFILRQPSLRRRGVWITCAVEVEGEFAGCAGVFVSGDSHEIGYWLGESIWGRGSATRCVERVNAEHARACPGRPPHDLVSTEDPASTRVLETAAFTRRRTTSGYSLQRRSHETLQCSIRDAVRTRTEDDQG